jgi:hypothetical protein
MLPSMEKNSYMSWISTVCLFLVFSSWHAMFILDETRGFWGLAFWAFLYNNTFCLCLLVLIFDHSRLSYHCITTKELFMQLGCSDGCPEGNMLIFGSNIISCNAYCDICGYMNLVIFAQQIMPVFFLLPTCHMRQHIHNSFHFVGPCKTKTSPTNKVLNM